MVSVRVISVVSLLALGACGTHQSVAPVVYGTDPNPTGRIYNAPHQAPTQRQVAARPTPVNASYTGYRAPNAQSSHYHTAQLETVELEPVRSIYLSDEERGEARRRSIGAQSKQVNPRVVSVRKGDTVYAIGRRYKIEPKAIIAENKLRAPYHLSVGQRLKLPGAVPLATKAAVAAPARRDVQVRVRKGDTLYSISKRTGTSVDGIARANGLRAPYTLSPGQMLVVRNAATTAPAPRQQVASAPRAKRNDQPAQLMSVKPATDVGSLARKASYSAPRASSEALFDWPVRGNIVSQFGIGELGRRNDGINIAAPAGTPVRAAADGEVVYRGSELDGFGNLLLLKHTDGFVTAYAHNDAMLVKKGDVVRRGQVVAKVGQTGAVTSPQLHFEIRQKLKSVDPLALLETK